MTKRQIRKAIFVSGLKPNYRVHVELIGAFGEIACDDIVVANALVRTLREAWITEPAPSSVAA